MYANQMTILHIFYYRIIFFLPSICTFERPIQKTADWENIGRDFPVHQACMFRAAHHKLRICDSEQNL